MKVLPKGTPIYPYQSLKLIPADKYPPLMKMGIQTGDAAFAVLAAWVLSDEQLAVQLANRDKLELLMRLYLPEMDNAQLTLAENPHLSASKRHRCTRFR